MDRKLGCKIHNHKLNLEAQAVFTQEILKEMDLWKGKTRSLIDLQEVINKKFATTFEYYQIVYQVKKLFDKNFGTADDDAYNFVEEIKKEISTNGGRFSIEKEQNRLKRVVFVSNFMLNYSQFFLDIVLIDSTYRRNRFNMPLVNVIGVNNYGKNILLAFGLLSDEKTDSYEWLLGKLKDFWRKSPQLMISDECDAIRNGKTLVNLFLLCSD